MRQLLLRLLKFYKQQTEPTRIQIIATIIIVTGLRYTTETFNVKDAKQYNGSSSMSALNVSCESVRLVDKLESDANDVTSMDEFGILPLTNDRGRLRISIHGYLLMPHFKMTGDSTKRRGNDAWRGVLELDCLLVPKSIR